MLEAMRQNSRSAIIYILFGILIAAFVISFGPGSPSGGTSVSSGGDYAAKVAGHEVSEKEFHFAYVALGAGNLPGAMAREQRIKEFIMDRLIDRELLAQEGERMGLTASENEAAALVAEGKMIILGMPRRVEGYAFKDGKFDYERFRMVAQNHYRVSIKELMEIQQRELLADKVRELMRSTTKVSPDEVKADFEDKGRQVNLEYVRFQPRRHEEDINLSDAEVEGWARAHEDAIKKAYEERKPYQFTKQDPSAHLRRVLIELPKDAPPEKVKEAEAKLEAAKKTLASGTRFQDVARTVSEDPRSRIRGGDMGWRKKAFTDLGDEADGKIFAAKEGDLLGPLRTDRGLELVRVEGFRKGDITLGQARTEIAEEMARSDKMKEKAKADAEEAMAKVKAGGKLAELFPKSTDADEAKAKTKQSAVQVEETGPFSRRGDVVQGLGSSQELAKAAFTRMKLGETLGPLEVAGTYVLATLKEKKEPDMADWDKRKAEIIEEYQRTKWAEVMQAYGKQRCSEIHAAGKIKVNSDVLAYEGGPAQGPLGMIERKYEPCAGQRPF